MTFQKIETILADVKKNFFNEPMLTVFDIQPEIISSNELKLTGKILEQKILISLKMVGEQDSGLEGRLQRDKSITE